MLHCHGTILVLSLHLLWPCSAVLQWVWLSCNLLPTQPYLNVKLCGPAAVCMYCDLNPLQKEARDALIRKMMHRFKVSVCLICGMKYCSSTTFDTFV